MPRSETRTGTSNRGFASMDPELQRAIASKGGKAAHQSGNAHRFTSEEAREAGRKGGQAAHRSSASNRRTAQDEVDFSKKDENEDSEDSEESEAGEGQSLQPGGKSAQQAGNQGRNSFSTDQERAGRSSQGH